MPDLLNWPLIDMFWVIVGNNKSKNYMKNIFFIKVYKLVVKYFWAHMSFIVYKLNTNQIIILFRVIYPNQYNMAKKTDKIHVSEIWKFVYT